MTLFVIVLATALSIVKANGWIVVPTYCIVLLYLFLFFYLSLFESVKKAINSSSKDRKGKENGEKNEKS